MTKTFPASLQYLFETLEDILCFEFGIWVIRICFGFRASSFGFTKIDYANNFVTSMGYLFK